MSADNRSSSALFKRAEQLKRWEESDTNKESSVPGHKPKKIQFSLGCVFLAACASGDKDEVLKLLEVGADIDTTNVDGLSALHQACIDDNLDMVEFLVEHGADINKGDNEGWTPLHATASCGFISIAKYLIEQGADIAAVNNDGELAVDIAESDEMEDMLQQVLNERGIDCDSARNEEERLMLNDAQKWLKNCTMKDIPHPKTGATALHVSAAKGYIKVMEMLLQAGANVNCQDYDGWTPLHAAAHWGQKEACEILMENFCDMDMKNYVGQTPFDISDPDIVNLLEELRDKQKFLLKERSEKYNMAPRSPEILLSPRKRNSYPDRLLSPKEKDFDVHHPALDDMLIIEETVSSDNVPKPEPEAQKTPDKITSDQSIINDVVGNYNEEKHRSPSLPDNLNKVPNNSVPIAPVKEDNNKENEDITTVPSWKRPASFKSIRNIGSSRFDDRSTGTNLVINNEDKSQEVGLRRTQSFESDEKFYRRYCELRAKINAAASNNVMPFNSPSLRTREKIRRGFMKEDLKLPLNAAETVTTCSTISAVSSTSSPIATLASSTGAVSTASTAATTSVTTTPSTDLTTAAATIANSTATATSTASSQDGGNANKDNLIGSSGPPPRATCINNSAANQMISVSAPTTPSSGTTKLSPGNIFKNFFKSFVPPVRDEESETQRKAHAKRVRETRRSTQGVTLEDIKWAEQLVKKKQQQLQQVTQPTNNGNIANNSPPSDNQSRKFENRRLPPTSGGVSVSATITTTATSGGNSDNNTTNHTSAVSVPTTSSSSATSTSFNNSNSSERRPSWRLKIDNGSKFMLEDARKDNAERVDSASADQFSSSRRSSVVQSQPQVPETADTTTITLPLRKLSRSTDDNDQEKDNDPQDGCKNIQSIQAVVQRRKRPKRRVTGVVQMDAEDADGDKDGTTNADNSNNNSVHETGSEEKSSYRSHRLSSSSTADNDSVGSRASTASANENGEIDYKKLYEETLFDNERLREKLRTMEENMSEAKSHYSNSAANNKYSLSESEKRERRAMERKLSEMEEELKLVEQLKQENQKLKDENGALIRVISKLSK